MANRLEAMLEAVLVDTDVAVLENERGMSMA